MQLHIKSIDESTVILDAELALIKELSQRFQYRVENFQFMQKYKLGIWDGYIRLIDSKKRTCPKGLVPDILKYCVDSNYEVSLDSSFKYFKEKIEFDIDRYNLPFTPHDFQLSAVKRALDKKRQIILSPTGSGKSLIQYLIAREYLNLVENKILIVVPTISLVTQLYNDFIEYAKNDEFDVESHCHLIYEGNVKNSDKKIIISTYQSIYNEPSTRDDDKKTTKRGNLYFEDFDAIMVDECHTVKGASLQSIMAKCINAKYRIGVTGTLDGSLTNEMVLKGQFGPIHRVANTTDLMDRNILSKLKIHFVNIKYDESTCINMKHADYHMEMDWLCTNPIRNKKICQISNKLKGNSLILVQFIEKHGKVLEIMLREMCTEKQVFFVYGNTEADDREKIRKIAETHSNVIILASYQVFSTGVNIKNLNNIIFGSPTKSKIRLLQSIGRGVRLHDDKEFLRVFDLCDDLRYNKRKSANYVLAHAMDRLKIYQVEGFDVIEAEITLQCN